jgi:hypothetical protein
MRIYVALTALLGGLPFLIYGWGRRFGGVPAEAEWFRVDPDTGFVVTNHGPWSDTWQGVVIFSCTQLLCVVLIATAVWFVASSRNLTLRKLGVFLCLLPVQLGLLVAQGRYLFWTID